MLLKIYSLLVFNLHGFLLNECPDFNCTFKNVSYFERSLSNLTVLEEVLNGFSQSKETCCEVSIENKICTTILPKNEFESG